MDIKSTKSSPGCSNSGIFLELLYEFQVIATSMLVTDVGYHKCKRQFVDIGDRFFYIFYKIVNIIKKVTDILILNHHLKTVIIIKSPTSLAPFTTRFKKLTTVIEKNVRDSTRFRSTNRATKIIKSNRTVQSTKLFQQLIAAGCISTIYFIQ